MKYKFTDLDGNGADYSTMLDALRFACGPYYQGRDVTAVLRVFALECARRVLPLYELIDPGDQYPRQCLDATGRFLLGQLRKEEMINAMGMVSGLYVPAKFSAISAAYYAAVAATGFGVYYRLEEWDESDPMDHEDITEVTTEAAAYSSAQHASRMVNSEEFWQEKRLRELVGVCCW
jgi:hypothetical protein